MQGGHERAEEAGSEEGEDEGKRRTGEGYQGLILNLVLINRNGEVLWGTFFFRSSSDCLLSGDIRWTDGLDDVRDMHMCFFVSTMTKKNSTGRPCLLSWSTVLIPASFGFYGRFIIYLRDRLIV